MTFVGVLEAIGKEFAKGLKWAAEYAVPVERLVAAAVSGCCSGCK